MKSLFPNIPFLPVNGCSDKKYLSDNTLINVLYPEKGSLYYEVETEQSHIYVFDSGEEGQSIRSDKRLNSYEWQQIKWFCQSLEKRVEERKLDKQNIVFIHIPYEQLSGIKFTPLTGALSAICEAIENTFEMEMELTWFDGVNEHRESPFTMYTYSGFNPGLIIGGYTKKDGIFYTESDQYMFPVSRRNLQGGGIPTFDICVYKKPNCWFYRVGQGNDASIRMP